MENQLKITTAQAMQKLGAAVATVCKPGCVIYLNGELGAGKTTFVRGFLQHFGYSGYVHSPTFTILESYQFEEVFVCHFDLYRMNAPQEFLNIGGRDYFTKDAICLIEWPQKGEGVLPSADLFCQIDFGLEGKGRLVRLIAETTLENEIIAKFKYVKK